MQTFRAQSTKGAGPKDLPVGEVYAPKAIDDMPPTGETPAQMPPAVSYAPPTYQHQVLPPRDGGAVGRAARNLILGSMALLLVLFIAGIIIGGRNRGGVEYVRAQKSAEIIVYQPRAEGSVEPPFLIVGEAHEDWFVDGIFPIRIYDADDNLVSRITARQTDVQWRTEGFLPFEASVDRYEFLPVDRRGYLLFQKNETSGIIGTEASVETPIRFKSLRNPKETDDEGGANGEVSSNDTTDPSTTGTDSGTTGQNGTAPNDTGTVGSAACSDGVDNDADGYTDSADPRCHSDNNAGNQNSYVPTRNTEREGYGCYYYMGGGGLCIDPPAGGGNGTTTNGGNTNGANIGTCGDHLDNDFDGRADVFDPDCHYDGNPSNITSFDLSRDE